MKKPKPNLIPFRNFPKKLRDPVKALHFLKNDPAESWEKRGQKMAINLFQEMAERVPAYKDFLAKNKIDPKDIRTLGDFKRVPSVDKDNYLRKYPLDQLSWDGKLNTSWTIYSSTSGSTGKPFYFPRDDFEDWEYSLVAELYLLNHYDIDKKSTLYVNGFAMGAWIGGLFTYQAIKNLAQRGNYKLGIISPGINKEEILNSIEALSQYYDQVIIGGYPPFVKDLIDYGVEQNFSWRKLDLKFVFSAESFSEDFRDYVLKNSGCKNPYNSSLNHYGTVDMGTMSHETPFTVFLRRAAMKNKPLFTDFFGDIEKTPTFTQYIPELFYFEETNTGSLMCTSRSGLPLVRYDLKDVGGITSFKKVENILDVNIPNWKSQLRNCGIEKTVLKLPFVHLYERSDFSLSWFGATIYPENIKTALQNKDISKYLTGRFTMEIVHDKKHLPKLHVHTELRPDVTKSTYVVNSTKATIIKTLKKDNSEYRSSEAQQKEGLVPEVVCWPHKHKKYFSETNKQKWVTKEKDRKNGKR